MIVNKIFSLKSSAFSLTALFSLLGLADLAQAASTTPLPQPSPTTTITPPNPSVRELGSTTSSVTAPTPLNPPIKKPVVVELKSEYINKNKALVEARGADSFQFVISYAISDGKTVVPEQLSTHYFYYLNRKTQKIGVALNKIAAQTLTQSPGDVYCAKEGDTLKTTITRWAKQGGYKIEWLSDYDYTLKYSYEFPGKLEDKTGPLNQILSSIAGSNYALKAVITQNNVILIKDNEFTPSVLSK